MTIPLRHSTILLAAVLAATVAAVAAPAAQASPAALQAATGSCWLDVINDWIAHNPNVVGTYPIPCYTQAIQHLSGMPDVQGYSNAPDDIHRALLAAIREQRGGGGGPGGGGTTPGNGNGNNGPLPGPGSNDPGGGGKSGGGGGILSHIFGAHDAQSVPLPLIVLGALAVLLALAAFGTWLARRLQTRRPAPAPAVSRRR